LKDFSMDRHELLGLARVGPGAAAAGIVGSQMFDAASPAQAAAVSQQFISVLDYGAVGDGDADDTAAIQSALDATPGRTFYFPRGKYKVSETLHITTRGHHQR
jgi:polygalacturonase